MAKNNRHLQHMYSLDYPIYNEADSISNMINDILLSIEDGQGASEDRWARLMLPISLMRSHLDTVERLALKAMTEENLARQTPN